MFWHKAFLIFVRFIFTSVCLRVKNQSKSYSVCLDIVKCHMNSQHATFLSSFGFHDHYLGEVKGQTLLQMSWKRGSFACLRTLEQSKSFPTMVFNVVPSNDWKLQTQPLCNQSDDDDDDDVYYSCSKPGFFNSSASQTLEQWFSFLPS